MPNRRKFLEHSISIMLVVGISLALIPLVQSLSPSEKADVFVRKIDVADFPNNTYRVVIDSEGQRINGASSTSFRNGSGWLIIRDNESEFRVFWIPIWEGKVPMPWAIWGQHEGYCSDFGPDHSSIKFNAGTVITCNDVENDNYFAEK